jgi:CPA1 family monovalent cation:H+ antiporter
MHDETVFILLFTVATTVAIAVRHLKIPYTVALVLAGLILGFFHVFTPPHLTKELLFAVFLPGLLFEAAFHIDFQSFWRNRTAILALAVPGVAVAVALTTLILAPVAGALGIAGFNWRHALVFAALISATDPIAVVAILRSLGAPARLSVLMEGESLLNDGTAIVFFTLTLALVTGNHVTASGLALEFVKVVGIGLVVGAVVGLLISQVIRQVDDPMIEITLTTIAAYGSFVVAEQFHASGVIATVTAGLLCGNYGARVGMSPSTRVAAETFWEYVAFALNSIVFLLIGFEIHLDVLIHSWQAVLIAYLAVTAGRGAVILGVSWLLRFTRERVPRSWAAVLTWGGLRGGLSMVLVLSLAPGFPHRDLLVSMTFGVVLLAIFIQAVTMSPLLRLLRVVEGRVERNEYELARGRLQAARAALGELRELSGSRYADVEAFGRLRESYEKTVEETQERLRELHLDREDIRNEEVRWALRRLLQVEKGEVIDALHRGMLNREVYEKLLADIDARLLRLESGEDILGGKNDFEGTEEQSAET